MPAATRAVALNSADIAEELTALAPEITGRNTPVVEIDTKPCPFTSFYQCTILNVRFAGGFDSQVFLKDYGSYPREKSDLMQRRERERYVYRKLLKECSLGTPIYYGSVWNEVSGRYWLFLEYVDGTRVRYCDLNYWLEAARWLARMQSSFQPQTEELLQVDLLQQLDESTFRAAASLARQVVERSHPELAEELAEIVQRYQQVVPLMAAEPRSLIHGAFRSGQVLVTEGSSTSRVCVVDWELAGLGPALYDLAELTYGFSGSRLSQFVEAYGHELQRAGIAPPSAGHADCLLRCFHLHRTLRALGKVEKRGFSRADTQKLIDMAKGFARGINSKT